MTTPFNPSILEGLCQCGCGATTPIQKCSDKGHGYIKGKPHAFLQGHGRRTRVSSEDAVPFKIDGVYSRLIPLSKGMYAIVDEQDYERLARYKWVARWSKYTQSFYAMRKGPTVDGAQTSIMMHREVLGLTRGDGRECDHIEMKQTWDNRRKNLRVADHFGNMQNRTKPRNNTTGFKGVTYVPARNRYRVIIGHNNRRIHVGYFREAETGHRAYCLKAQQLHGQFARG